MPPTGDGENDRVDEYLAHEATPLLADDADLMPAIGRQDLQEYNT